MNTRVRIMAVILCLYYLTDKIGCGGTARSSIDENTVKQIMHVQEWADAIDLWQGKNLRLMSFQRTGLGIWIRYLEREDAAVKNLAEIVEASNQFVKENPGYFQREDYKINIYVGYKKTYFALSNHLPSGRFKMSGIDFDIEEDFRLQYFYVRGEYCMQQCLEMGDTKMDIPVVLWDMEKYEISNQEEYDLSFLDCFTNLEYFVVHFDNPELKDYTVLKERIEEKLPDCDVYILHEGESLEK